MAAPLQPVSLQRVLGQPLVAALGYQNLLLELDTLVVTLCPHITLDTENAVGSEFAVVAINREVFAIEPNGVLITQADTVRQARITVLYKFGGLPVITGRQFAQRSASAHEGQVSVQLRVGSCIKSPYLVVWAVIATQPRARDVGTESQRTEQIGIKRKPITGLHNPAGGFL